MTDSASGTDFDLPLFRDRLAALAGRGIYLGSSSWKYLGWIGQVYTRSRYEYRGRFAESRFETNCLTEYAEAFPTVCVDGSYYTWPDAKRLQLMADMVPPSFRFGFKVTDHVTIKRYPNFPRFGPKAGQMNPDFLNAAVFAERFLGPLTQIRPKVGPVMFEFSKFYPAEYSTGAAFIEDLDRFLGALPKDWSYGVEIRNKSWLVPDYLNCLRRHNVTHVFNNWGSMPAVSEQLDIVGDLQAEGMRVARFLTKPGMSYESSKEEFAPYDRTKEVNEDARAAAARLVKQGSIQLRNGVYVYFNNRLEGSAIFTIVALLERLFDVKEGLGIKPSAPPAATPPTGSSSEPDQFGLTLE